MADNKVQWDRYDRQLRIWGPMGQELLETAHVCLIGPGSTLLREILRNLVLLGVSTFTWIEQENVFNEYTNSNIYNYADMLRPGEIRFNTVRSSTQPVDYSMFNLIVKLNIHKEVKFQSRTGRNLPPIIIIKTAGFYGYVKLELSEPHIILDPHNEYPKVDLRLDNLWNELEDYLCARNTITLNYDIEYPYPVILYHAMRRRGPCMAGDTSSTKVLKQKLEEMSIKKHQAQGSDSLNYLEAQRYASRAYVKPEHDQFIKRLNDEFNLYAIQQVKKNKDKWSDFMNDTLFDLVIKLTEFIKNVNMGLPLQGNFPDMECDHNEYQKLKAIYDRRRKIYINFFIYESHLKESSRCYDLVEYFFRSFLDLTIIKPMSKKEKQQQSKLFDILSSLKHSGKNTSQHYEFKNLEKPAIYPVDVFLAGLASQEAIKLITHQFIPINNTFVYDGLNGEYTETLRTK